MRKINNLDFLLVVGVCMIVGCSAPKPELMPQGERDKLTYLDKGAMTKREDVSFRIAVCVDQKEYERYPKAGDAVETQMAEAVSKFKLFQFVDRSRINALAAEKLFQGQSTDASSLLTAADYLLSVKLNVSMEECKVRVDFNGKRNKHSNRFAKMWRLNVKPDFRLFEVDSGKVELVKPYEGCVELPGSTIEEARANLQPSIASTMKMLTKAFSTILISRYAPKARVLQTRGDGSVAQISIGKEYGISPGMEVEFYGYEDNSDIVAGGERSESTVGYGRVLEDIGPKFAWVEVLDHSSVKVLRGHYVRVREEKRSEEDSILTALKNFGTVKDEDCIVESHVVPDRATPSVARPVPVAQPVARSGAAPVNSAARNDAAASAKAERARAKAEAEAKAKAKDAIGGQQNGTGHKASSDSKGIRIVVQGKGKTKETALRSAFRQAVWKTVGTWVGSKTRIEENRARVIAQVETITEADIRKFEIMDTQQQGDIIVVKVKVSVLKKQIAPKFASVFPDVFGND